MSGAPAASGPRVGDAAGLLAEFSAEGAVDTTCHLGQWPFRLSAAASADDLRTYAARHGLTRLWVSHLACLFGFDTRTGNEACLAACAGDDLFRVFAVLDPTEPTWPAELAEMRERGAVGIRIAPGFHGCSLSEALDVAAACRDADLALQVLVRLDDARVRHPRFLQREPQPHEIAAFLRATTDADVLVSGVRWDEWDEVVRHLADVDLPRVRVDLWHVNGPLNIVDRMATEPDRWVFGSGFPVQTPEATMLQLTASGLSAAQRSRIARGAAERMLPDR